MQCNVTQCNAIQYNTIVYLETNAPATRLAHVSKSAAPPPLAHMRLISSRYSCLCTRSIAATVEALSSPNESEDGLTHCTPCPIKIIPSIKPSNQASLSTLPGKLSNQNHPVSRTAQSKSRHCSPPTESEAGVTYPTPCPIKMVSSIKPSDQYHTVKRTFQSNISLSVKPSKQTIKYYKY